MNRGLITFMVLMVTTLLPLVGHAQEDKLPPQRAKGYLVPATIDENGDTIPTLTLPMVYVYAPLRFTTNEQRREYRRLVRDVKKALPYAKMVSETLLETYEYMETLPNERARRKHIKQLEKDLLDEYTPKMKKLTLRQGKLVIKLISRECGTNSYEILNAFAGRFSANFWNTFAKTFGTSLKVDYDPEGEDALIERICIQVERGLL